MADMMTFPDTVEEFMEQYKITDTDQVYTNGVEMVPIFRMKQWFEHQVRTQMSVPDCISRQAAIDEIGRFIGYIDEDMIERIRIGISRLPSAQPDVLDTNVGNANKFIDGLVEIFADIRERHVDDSVCGLCEYDGAYIGESGDWCNECPGFDRDDCFKLRDGIRKKWIAEITACMPSAEPEIISCKNCRHDNNCEIQYAAQTGSEFFCGAAERRGE